MITPEQTRQVLDTRMQPNDAGATTIREYLAKIVEQVWQEGECFSGKRPFGNSSWQWEVHQALFEAGLVEGELDKYGDLEDYDRATGNELVLAAITELGR